MDETTRRQTIDDKRNDGTEEKVAHGAKVAGRDGVRVIHQEREPVMGGRLGWANPKDMFLHGASVDPEAEFGHLVMNTFRVP
jgi:hypothetical protein